MVSDSSYILGTRNWGGTVMTGPPTYWGSKGIPPTQDANAVAIFLGARKLLQKVRSTVPGKGSPPLRINSDDGTFDRSLG
eukprot:scaffold499_cov335-Pavlova_lutheri.AAC.1